MKLASLITAAALSLIAAGASAQTCGNNDMPTPTNASYDYVADAQGLTLYTFDNDAWGKPNCYDGCTSD